MRAGLYLALLAGALVAVATCAASGAAKPVPKFLFPVVGAAQYYDDFGEPRGGLKHQGIDLIAARRAPAVAVEDGHVEYWTASKSAGCMLYLFGDSGTMYEYIHLNNDLTAKNDNGGKCVLGTAYAVPDRATVAAGQQIGYVGDSGDANGIHPHLHFEVHPSGKSAVDPFRYLNRAPHLLAPAPSAGQMFTLKLTGTVASATATSMTLTADSVAAWPSHVRQSKIGVAVSLALAAGESFSTGERIVAWTRPALGSVAALTGAPGALMLDRFSDA
ncbi:MAG TPA: M23 family metallopeptidase [Gaiellaceae bacterium]|nr:M23 family metallopeptidase [Gaiellaceae bacterium]